MSKVEKKKKRQCNHVIRSKTLSTKVGNESAK